jgi:hypothetical protein
VRRLLVCVAALVSFSVPDARAQAPAAKATDLDAFMARALQRRDTDRKNLSDYVLDEVEEFEVLGPGRVPFARMRREYTWYVRDGMHVRSPLRYDGIPIPEEDRRAYEARWIRSEESRRKFRTTRDQKRAAEGKAPAVSVPSVNEPRFISESYFLDFKFEPGNYYLAGKETLDGKPVLKIDYLPTRLFDDEAEREEDRERKEISITVSTGSGGGEDKRTEAQKQEDARKLEEQRKKDEDERQKREARRSQKEKDLEAAIERKMNKTSQVTLWVDPATHQIVKYTFDNVWLDFLPAGWLVRVDDLRANMQMFQPFPDVWLPKNMTIHAGVTLALGSMELQYTRGFSNYRKADVASRVTVPKKEAR